MDPGRQPWRRSSRGCSSRIRAGSSARAGSGSCFRIPAATWCGNPCWTRRPSRSAETTVAHWPRSPAWASTRGREASEGPLERRARAARPRGCRRRRARPPDPRRADPRHRPGPEVSDRGVARRTTRLAGALSLSPPMTGASRPIVASRSPGRPSLSPRRLAFRQREARLPLRLWAALDPSSGALAVLLAASRAPGRRRRLARGRPGSRQGSDPRRHARRARRRRARPLRADPECATGDGHRRSRGGRARAAARVRGRRAGSARVQLLPRPGPAHPLADARLGRVRRRSPGLARRTLEGRLAFVGFCFALGFGLRGADGPLALVRLLASQRRCPGSRAGRRRCLQRCTCDRERRYRSQSPGRSCAGCSSAMNDG